MHIIKNFPFFLFSLLLCTLSTQQTSEQIKITLTPGSVKQIAIPDHLAGFQKYQLSAFTHQQKQITSFPCFIEQTQPSHFNRMGQFQHQRTQVIEDSFWQGGNLWHVGQSGNQLFSVFQSGQVFTFKSKGIDTTYKPYEKIGMTKPLQNKKIPFGRLLSFEQPQKVFHTLYFSEEGCFHINQNGSWTKMSGYQGTTFEQAKSHGKDIYAVDRDKIVKYTVDLSAKKLTKQKQYWISFRQDGHVYPLTISNFYIDRRNQRIFLIDNYEGVKYIPIKDLDKGQAKHLLPFQRCQDILIADQGLTFISCSHLIIINSTTLSLVSQSTFPFHVSKVFFSQGYLTAFGDNQYAIYSLLVDSAQKIKVEYILRGNIPDRIYSNFMHIEQSSYFLLFSKQSMEFGRISPSQSKIFCQNIRVAEKSNYQDLVGISTATLSLHGKCDAQPASTFLKECSRTYSIVVDIINIKEYKWIFWVVLGGVVLVLLVVGIWKLVKLRRQKNELLYAKLNQDSIVTEESKIQDQNSDAKRQSDIQLPDFPAN